MKWWEVRLDIPFVAVEAVSALFIDYPEVKGVVFEGISEEKPPHPEYGEWFSEDLYTQTDRVNVIVYFPEYLRKEEVLLKIDSVQQQMKSVESIFAEQVDMPFTMELIDESSWEEAWKEHFEPLPVGEKFMIVPIWHENQVCLNERYPIVMEPGMAFGTGTHETTQLCLEAMEQSVLQGLHVLDIGCGTAVLSIGAARLGASSVLAIDIDPVAVKVAKENVQLNGMNQVLVREGDLLTGIPDGIRYDFAVANILRDVVLSLLPQLKNCLRIGGLFLSSGFILSQVQQVEEGLLEQGFRIKQVYTKKDWAAIVAVREV